MGKYIQGVLRILLMLHALTVAVILLFVAYNVYISFGIMAVVVLTIFYWLVLGVASSLLERLLLGKCVNRFRASKFTSHLLLGPIALKAVCVQVAHYTIPGR